MHVSLVQYRFLTDLTIFNLLVSVGVVQVEGKVESKSSNLNIY